MIEGAGLLNFRDSTSLYILFACLSPPFRGSIWMRGLRCAVQVTSRSSWAPGVVEAPKTSAGLLHGPVPLTTQHRRPCPHQSHNNVKHYCPQQPHRRFVYIGSADVWHQVLHARISVVCIAAIACAAAGQTLRSMLTRG
jgi:hypothetical protein